MKAEACGWSSESPCPTVTLPPNALAPTRPIGEAILHHTRQTYSLSLRFHVGTSPKARGKSDHRPERDE